MENNDISENDRVQNIEAVQYVGFGSRFLASIIDSVLVVMLTLPILYSIYGAEYFETDDSFKGSSDFIISYILPVLVVILFWIYKSATPGKMLVSAKIVDAKTGNQPTPLQCITRYLGYYVSMFALGLGFLWIVWDDKKQGWHDKMAGTVVIYS
ncbi:MAG: RDD family protein [Colwellia polaris]|jgi:uncharacterized RDD family membrane protein YckC|uniref:RDD family protein n=1 Tax=Colwellia polaris TaxID=326537 RepID=UPI000A174D49|nr:RDD family protein [Colwellia polaris]|tara:strand:- start:12123 stop:12584 length:462 start_codon:yes stop_codon:yes gene_type:complete